MERQVRSYLSNIEDIFLPRRDFLENFIEGKPPATENQDAKLSANFLTVHDGSCYGALSIFPTNRSHPKNEDFDHSRQLSLQLFEQGLCSSIMLVRGCMHKGLFGNRFVPAIIAPPDIAKLAVLKRFGDLDVAQLPQVVGKLNADATREIYCENNWETLGTACRADVRFGPVLAIVGQGG